MKKVTFILGLIGGIMGIISCLLLLFIGLTMKVTIPDGITTVIITIINGGLGLLATIAGLVGACIAQNNNKLAGILMIIATIFNIIVSFTSINAQSPLSFLMGFIVAILFLISSIFAFKSKSI